MLDSLHVENIALIRSCDIYISGGLTVLTGETGAGKSLIIDSLCLLCGAKSDRSVIRTGENYALVEGVFFGVPDTALEMLSEDGIQPEDDGSVIVTRRITSDGRSTARICGRAVTLSRLREIMSYMLTIHGQQDTQTLSDPERQLYMLDLSADNGDLLTAYREKYDTLKQTDARITSLQSAADDRAERIDMLDYRINELSKLNITLGEEEALISEKTRIQSYESITAGASEAHEKLSTVGGRVNAAISALKPLQSVLPETQALSDRLYNIMYEAEDITETLGAYMGDGDGDDREKRLDMIQERLMTFNTLKRRYRVQSADGLIEKLQSMQKERADIDGSDELLAELQKRREKEYADMQKAARSLTESRKTAAKALVSDVLGSLSFLDMPSVRFEIEITAKQPSADGCDDVCFMISANKGEELRRMSRIASGGELSRIMLAVAKALHKGGADGTLIFDEIDTGISGSTSDKIGILLSTISEGGQVICVTHSAQISSRADTHMLISKHESQERTVTSVEKLDRDGRIKELARILGGVNVAKTTVSAAAEMLENAKKTREGK